METRLPVYKRILFLLILITSITLSILFISPKFDGNILFGISIGIIASVILISLISLEIRKMSKKLSGENSILGTMKNVYAHPTQIPMMVGLLWFGFALIIVAPIVKFLGWQFSKGNASLGIFMLLAPLLISIGISGLLMIIRKETVDKFGHIYEGFWGVFTGILGIIIGWGGFIFMVLAYIFNW